MPLEEVDSKDDDRVPSGCRDTAGFGCETTALVIGYARSARRTVRARLPVDMGQFTDFR